MFADWSCCNTSTHAVENILADNRSLQLSYLWFQLAHGQEIGGRGGVMGGRKKTLYLFTLMKDQTRRF